MVVDAVDRVGNHSAPTVVNGKQGARANE